jgi:hypothetical protein
MAVLLQLRELGGKERNKILAFLGKPDFLQASRGKSSDTGITDAGYNGGCSSL